MSKVLDISQYTEVDPSGRLTPNYTGFSVAGSQRSTNDFYLYKDYGVGYFSSGVYVKMTVTLTSGTATSGDDFCAFKNSVGYSDYVTYPDTLTAEAVYNGSWLLAINEYYGGTRAYTAYALAGAGTYYLTMTRDETVGANGTAYLYIYSDAARTTLLQTISLALRAKLDYRYFYPSCSIRFASHTGLMTYSVSDITLAKLEDLTAYTEVDPNGHLAVSGDSVAGTGITRSESCYIYTDKGAGYFGGNFTVELNSNQSAAAPPVGKAMWALPLLLSDSIGGEETGNIIGFELARNAANTTSYVYVVEHYLGGYYASAGQIISQGTRYYYRAVRDEAASASGTFYVYCYSNAAMTALVGTQSVALHGKVNYRYLYAMASYNDASDGSITLDSQNLAIVENHRYEDFTTYTEIDPNSRVTVDNANKITGTGLLFSDGSTYVYKDYGANYFSSHFYHEGVLTPVGTGTGDAYCWGMSNTIGDVYVRSTVVDTIDLGITGNTSQLWARKRLSGTYQGQLGSSLTAGQKYYYRVVRDETTAILSWYIFTNSLRTTLLTTLTLAMNAAVDFRYLYALAGWNPGAGANSKSLVHENLDINYEPPPYLTKILTEILTAGDQIQRPFSRLAAEILGMIDGNFKDRTRPMPQASKDRRVLMR